MIPGITVHSHTAIKLSPDIMAYTIPGMLGGIRIPRKPEDAISAPEYARS